MEDLTFVLWTVCPVCNGLGQLDCSAPEDPPWTHSRDCWRCKGDCGWLKEDEDAEPNTEGDVDKRVEMDDKP